jgi:hypothetical protein
MKTSCSPEQQRKHLLLEGGPYILNTMRPKTHLLSKEVFIETNDVPARTTIEQIVLG